MSYAKLSPSVATAINLARDHAGNDERKQLKKEMFASAKAQFGIPDNIKVKAETRDTSSPDYLLLKDSRTGQTFALAPDGLWVNADRSAQQAAPAIRTTRWFLVGSRADLLDLAKEHGVSNGDDWDDDNVTLPCNTSAITDDLHVDPQFDRVYVQMAEDELI